MTRVAHIPGCMQLVLSSSIKRSIRSILYVGRTTFDSLTSLTLSVPKCHLLQTQLIGDAFAICGSINP
jgi:hypothetical protein